jgi:hypothetical protein
MEDFTRDVLSSPVMQFYYWNNGGGGADCRLTPLSYYGPSIFPNTAEVSLPIPRLTFAFHINFFLCFSFLCPYVDLPLRLQSRAARPPRGQR